MVAKRSALNTQRYCPPHSTLKGYIRILSLLKGTAKGQQQQKRKQQREVNTICNIAKLIRCIYTYSLKYVKYTFMPSAYVN